MYPDVPIRAIYTDAAADKPRPMAKYPDETTDQRQVTDTTFICRRLQCGKQEL